MRSPTFPSLDRKDLWVERTRDLALNDFDRAVIEGEINAMTDEEVTAALASSAEKEDVQDPPVTAPATGPKPVIVTDDNSSEEEEEEVQDPPPGILPRVPKPIDFTDFDDDNDDPTNRYSMPLPPRNPRHGLDIPVQPYLPRRTMRYEEDLRSQHPSISQGILPRIRFAHDAPQFPRSSLRRSPHRSSKAKKCRSSRLTSS